MRIPNVDNLHITKSRLLLIISRVQPLSQ